jgi:hypothetical protein
MGCSTSIGPILYQGVKMAVFHMNLMGLVFQRPGKLPKGWKSHGYRAMANLRDVKPLSSDIPGMVSLVIKRGNGKIRHLLRWFLSATSFWTSRPVDFPAMFVDAQGVTPRLRTALSSQGQQRRAFAGQRQKGLCWRWFNMTSGKNGASTGPSNLSHSQTTTTMTSMKP